MSFILIPKQFITHGQINSDLRLEYSHNAKNHSANEMLLESIIMLIQKFGCSPLITSPEPSLNLKGLFLSLDESNLSPVDAIMPGKQTNKGCKFSTDACSKYKILLQVYKSFFFLNSCDLENKMWLPKSP